MEIIEGGQQPDTDVPKEGLTWAKEETLGDFNDVIKLVSNNGVLAYSRCKQYSYLENKEKLVSNQMGKASIAYDHSGFSMKGIRKPRVGFLKMFRMTPNARLDGMTPERLHVYLEDSCADNSEQFVKLKWWRSGADKRSNGKMWVKPNERSCRMTVNAFLFNFTAQLEVNLLPREEYAKSYQMSEDLLNTEELYDKVFLLERTRINPNQKDRMHQCKLFMKFKQIENDVTCTLVLQEIDTLFFPDMVLRNVLRQIAFEIADSNDRAMRAWPDKIAIVESSEK